MIFLGLGLGIAASGTIIPKLLQFGLQDTWIGLGVLSLVLSVASWFGWPAAAPTAPSAKPAPHAVRPNGLALRVLYAQYAANALGLVPAMILLVDYVARGLGRGAGVGAGYWVLYGIAAIFGPVICGNVADRIGFGAALSVRTRAAGGRRRDARAVRQSGNARHRDGDLGIFTPGIVPLVLGRIHELVPHDHVEQRAAWSRATTAFALFQAVGGYGYSFLFAHTNDDYSLIFWFGAAALSLAFVADILSGRSAANKPATN